MKTVVQKWGNSLAVRIPGHLARDSGVRRGSPVEITNANGQLVVIPLSKRRLYSLSSLVKKISRKNRHGEVDFGKAAGREIW
jgi:antitoxin MazE